MPKPIQCLTVGEFEGLLDAWTTGRKIDAIHIHCTDQPRHSNFRGLASVEAMRTYHMSIGMSDIAQHLTIDPRGLLWTGRPFDAMPASVRGQNGSAKKGPFMIEMVGLFEKEKGKVVDRFEGDQKSAVYRTVCAVLRKFELDENAVRFHREFPKTGKTCPGSDLDLKSFRADIRAELASESLRSFEASIPRGAARAPVDRDAVLAAPPTDVADFLEVPEDSSALEEQEMLANWLDRGLVEATPGVSSRGAEPEYQELLPHLVNTSQGILSKVGAVWTSQTDLQNLIERHLTPAFESGNYRHLLFYAHGGLNSEKGALDYAKVMAPWWRSYGVYPVYFIWESSLFQSIFQAPRDLRGGGERGFGDFFDGVAEALTRRLATKVWSRMKANARRCSAPMTEFGRPGGLHEFWTALEPWLMKHKEVELHAIGHSTGPILLSRFLPLLAEDASGRVRRTIRSLTYLAPAIRVDEFLRDVEPRLGPGRAIEQLRVFTMSDAAERDDTVAKVYRKSLLYYVRQACEGTKEVPILGLERDLYGNPNTRQLFGLRAQAGDLRAPDLNPSKARATIEFSQDEDAFPQNSATAARQHGFFDNDPVTMSSVLAGILGVSTPVGHPGGRPFPSRAEFEQGEALDDVAERGLEADEPVAAFSCCCCRRQGEGDRFDADFDAGLESLDEQTSPAPPRPVDSGTGASRRVALCVGIDDYPRQALAGCVADSENWARALARERFEIRRLRNSQATREALDRALRELVLDARTGDHLVLQFAGHGSQVEDLSGDESDRFDEVVVPVDFDRGALWTDDDLYEICRLLPSGARLTMIMDCCHSGTNARFAPTTATGRGGARARFVALESREVTAYKRKRTAARFAVPVNERTPLPGVVHFAACRDREVAYEEDGQGNFSRNALTVFERVLAGHGSNRAFQEAVALQFGNDRRQHPVLDETAAGLDSEPFLGGR